MREVLPDLLIVADKFHVVKRVNRAVWQVWPRLLRGRPQDDPLPKNGELALHADEQLSLADRAALDALFRDYPLLHRAQRLKEDLRHWYRRCSAKDARLELSAWRRMVTDLPELPEFAALGGSMAVQKVLEEIDPEALAKDCLDFVSVKSETGQEGPGSEFFADLLRQSGWTVTADDVEPGRPNVAVHIPGASGGPTLMFNGHVDTIPIGKSWPPRREGNLIHSPADGPPTGQSRHRRGR